VTRRTTLAKLSTEGHPRPSRAVSSPDPNGAHLALAGSLEKNRTYVPSGRFYPGSIRPDVPIGPVAADHTGHSGPFGPLGLAAPGCREPSGKTDRDIGSLAL